MDKQIRNTTLHKISVYIYYVVPGLDLPHSPETQVSYFSRNRSYPAPTPYKSCRLRSVGGYSGLLHGRMR